MRSMGIGYSADVSDHKLLACWSRERESNTGAVVHHASSTDLTLLAGRRARPECKRFVMLRISLHSKVWLLEPGALFKRNTFQFLHSRNNLRCFAISEKIH